MQIVLWHKMWGDSTAAPALTTGQYYAPNEPDCRIVVDFRGITSIKIQGGIRDNASTNKLAVQYSFNMNFTSGSGTWSELLASVGNHTSNRMFYDGIEYAVPDECQAEQLLLRPALHDGNGVATPKIICCILNCYPSQQA
jgi:hypothetical protein